MKELFGVPVEVLKLIEPTADAKGVVVLEVPERLSETMRVMLRHSFDFATKDTALEGTKVLVLDGGMKLKYLHPDQVVGIE